MLIILLIECTLQPMKFALKTRVSRPLKTLFDTIVVEETTRSELTTNGLIWLADVSQEFWYLQGALTQFETKTRTLSESQCISAPIPGLIASQQP